MEKRIERDIVGNYIVLDCNETGYKIRMLESNRIPGILPVSVREEDGKKKLYYDISSRICLRDALGTRTLNAEEIRNMVYAISRILTALNEHLLSASDLVLDESLVYVKTPSMEISVCCYPGYGGNFTAEFSNLLRELLGAVDQRDKDAVVLTYSLYQESLKENYVMEDILRILRCDSIREIEEQTAIAVETAVANGNPSMEEPDMNELYEYVADDNSELSGLKEKKSRRRGRKLFAL